MQSALSLVSQYKTLFRSYVQFTGSTIEEVSKLKKSVFRKSLISIIFLVIFFSCFLEISRNPASASGGSITAAKCYPNDTDLYPVIDHFTEQFLSVNTNTTISVSIDGRAPIPMNFQGLVTETGEDSLARDWYTWVATVPTITVSGIHTFQFLGHYYVWQEVDQYWAEFNYRSDIHSFIISNTEQPNQERINLGDSNKGFSLSLSENMSLNTPQLVANNEVKEAANTSVPNLAYAYLVGTICSVVGSVFLLFASRRLFTKTTKV